MFVAVMFSLNLAVLLIMFKPVVPTNDPDPTLGKLPVRLFLGVPLLSKYSGVGAYTALTLT